MELALRGDQRVKLQSSLFAEQDAPSSYVIGQEQVTNSWIDYVQGVTWVLRREGHVFGGFDLRVESQVPVGSGLSSSAALEVSVMRAMREAFHLELDDVTLAKIGQRVENEFVGARVGIMDQMACSVGRPGEALFLDTRDLSFRHIPIPSDLIELAVIHSGVAHSNAQGEYNRRRAECEEACRALGIQSLRELGMADLGKLNSLPPPLCRRAHHVITENERVLRAVSALEARDVANLGELLYASHRSLRDDYQVSIPELDELVELASRHSAVYGARFDRRRFRRLHYHTGRTELRCANCRKKWSPNIRKPADVMAWRW